MSMKTLRLQLFASTEEAIALIEFLDQLRDALADTYGDDIQQMMCEEQDKNSDQFNLPFDDPIDFLMISL